MDKQHTGISSYVDKIFNSDDAYSDFLRVLLPHPLLMIKLLNFVLYNFLTFFLLPQQLIECAVNEINPLAIKIDASLIIYNK
jgi:hypothetical protein